MAERPRAVGRSRLEQLLDRRHPYLQMIEQTAAADLAHDWLTLLPTIEGVVAKPADGRMSYPPSSFYAAYQSFLRKRGQAKLAPRQPRQVEIDFGPGVLRRALDNLTKKRARNE